MISMRYLPSHKLVRIGNATAAWGVLFALVHAYWAAGGEVGTNGKPARRPPKEKQRLRDTEVATRQKWTPVRLLGCDSGRRGRLAAAGFWDLDAWHFESARDLLLSLERSAAPELEAYVLLHASGLVKSCVIRLAVGQTPGDELSTDSEWAALGALSRREVLAHRSAGLDAGMVDRSLRLLGWVDLQIGSWPEPEPDQKPRASPRRV